MPVIYLRWVIFILQRELNSIIYVILSFLRRPETQIVRDRLKKYMNSDKIRINDLNYMKDLNKKIEEYHKVILISFRNFW